MNIHDNARLTPKGRALLVRRILGGEKAQAAAAACGVSERTAYRWLRRLQCTNGKAERFIQTALKEWAYARSYHSSEQRAAHLIPWLHDYNWHRPHAGIHLRPPFSRLLIPMNNVLTLHS